MGKIQQGTSTFRKVNIAFFAAGFNTFAILYSTQPLLPTFSVEFHVSPAVASLSLSLTTVSLGISMLLFGSLSEVWGRKPVMFFSMFTASILSSVTAFCETYHAFLAMRIVLGFALGGLPSIAMAYLGEEIESKSLGVAMGLYISGNSLGAIGGRLITGTLADLVDWHMAMGIISVISLLSSIIFLKSLPKSQNFQPHSLKITHLSANLFEHLKKPKLLALFSIGFLLLGSNVALFNYMGYVLTSPPYLLSQTLVAWIFIIYVVGMFSSVFMAKLANQFGNRKILALSIIITLVGVDLTLSGQLWIKVVGMAATTFGFFGGHSIASSWVGRRALHNKAQASSLYLCFYYSGSSIGGTAAGMFWSSFGWDGVVGMISGFLLVALILTLFLSSGQNNASIVKQQSQQ